MFADKLRELRRARNLTQAQLAEQLGVSTSAVGMYEQGRREPDSAMLARMASCLCTSIDNLLCVGGVPQQPAQTEVDEIIDGLDVYKRQASLSHRLYPVRAHSIFSSVPAGVSPGYRSSAGCVFPPE